MRKLRFLWLVIVCLHVGVTHAETPNPKNTTGENPEVITAQPLGRYPRWKALLDQQDKFWFAYYRADEKLNVRRPDGSELLLNPVDRPSAFSGLAIASSGDGLSILWRDKLPKKALYFLPNLGEKGEIPQPVIIDEDSEPLTRFAVAKDKGETYFLWYGEKNNPGQKKYQLYFRYLAQDGKTLSSTQMLMPGIYPAWIIDDDRIPVFSWVPADKDKDKKDVMAMRVFDRAKKEFGPFIEIAEAPPIGPFFFTLKSGGRWFLFWLGHYGQDGRDYLLEGIFSEDKGLNWKRFSFEALRKLDLSDVQPVADGKGNILLVLSGRTVGSRNDIFLLRSTDHGTTWSEPQRPRPEAVRITKADHPSITFGSKPGSAIMVWEDWRDIRASIYAAHTTDNGATWSDAVPVTSAGAINMVSSFNSESVMSGQQDRYYLIARQFSDDALTNSKLVKYMLTPEQLTKKHEVQGENQDNPKATEARLRERFEAYWSAMRNGNYDQSYGLLDPFFRARKPFEQYRPLMGKIIYHSYALKSIAINGNIAKIKIENEASVPEFRTSSGQSYSVPQKKISFTETWVFVGSDWYREYYDEMAEMRYTRY